MSLLLLTACATLPVAYAPPPGDTAMPPPRFRAPAPDVPTVLHIHTRYSDGHGTIPAIARIAARQGIRVVYITDHDTLAGRQRGEAGWHGETLVLVGEELTSRAGHIVTLNIEEPIPPDQPANQALAAIAAQGGLGFIAHPYWSGEPWRDWPSANAAAGLELYNLAHDAQEESRLKLLLTAVPLPARLFAPHILDRPTQALAQWDEMTRQHRVVGIAGNDAHGLQWTPLVRLAPYDLSLACVRTHLLMSEVTPEAVHQALADGHAFIGFDLLGDTSGCTLTLLQDDRVIATMGDEVPMRDDLFLYIWTPRRCTIRLLRDGQPIATVEGYEHRAARSTCETIRDP
jgi:hypothetical protein